MNAERSLRAVVFDLDGLMFNTEELYVEVGQELLRRRGKEFTRELLDQMMGRPSRIALQLMIDWHRLEATVAELEAETDVIFPSILDGRLNPMTGLFELLDAVEQAGLPKAIATSSRRAFLERVLAPFELLPRFQFTLTAEDVQHGKPAPEIYLKAASRFELPPEALLVLEDSENGCKAAVAAGTFAVAVPGLHNGHHQYPGAQFIARTLRDERIYQALGLAPPQH